MKCVVERCRASALLDLFGPDGTHIASVCLPHAGQVIWERNELVLVGRALDGTPDPA